ncbi:chlorophyll synthesis pathway protein BchC [Lichenicoccus sp.]|uniref:chlorophyll synthesis pathway protein BchC n=1 Tax=Lichenicoccus sp. TaxID=2781899 RepID=UPI003D0AD904
MRTLAVVMSAPGHAALEPLDLTAPGDADVVVDVAWSGISAGTERLLWSGRMPDFPGMGYPLVPGYESVGRIVQAGAASGRTAGEMVFVPGARCFGAVRGLFGGAAARLVTGGARVAPIANDLGDRGTLLALAATAHHAVGQQAPDLVVGHGVLGRLIARITIALGHPAPVVWEALADRSAGADGYVVTTAAQDAGRSYRCIVDASGDAGLLDGLIARLAPGGEVVLAGFYAGALSFSFPPAFMREARLRCAAEWKPDDLAVVQRLIAERLLSLDGLITHRRPAAAAQDAYHTAFNDIGCLKMILDWSASA